MTDRQDYEVTGMNAGMPSQASCQWTADPAPMRLELIGVSKAFDSKVVADRIDLSVRQGEAFTLLGPSGSGKSTLLRIVAGLEAADAGKVRIAGRDMAHVPPWKRNLGMVFQQYAVFPHMSVAANVGYGLKVRGRSRQEIEAQILETTYRGSSIDYALRLIDGQRLTASMPEPASDGSNGRTRVGFNPADLVLLRD